MSLKVWNVGEVPSHADLNTNFQTVQSFVSLPGQPYLLGGESTDIGHFCDYLLTDTQAGPHSTTDYAAVAIQHRPVGSGANGPQAGDFCLAVSGIKHNWQTTTQAGELDGVYVVLRNGGAGDSAAYLANVGVTTGLALALEGTIYQMATGSGAVLKGINVQVGAIQTGGTGSAISAGYYAGATNGVIDAGLQLSETSGGTFTNFLRCISYTAGVGVVTYQVSRSGGVRMSNVNGTGLSLGVDAAGLLYVNDNGGTNQNLALTQGGALTVRGAVNSTGYQVSTVQVVGARSTGWTVGTSAAPNKGAINYDTATAAQLGARVAALEAALTAHGLIGA